MLLQTVVRERGISKQLLGKAQFELGDTTIAEQVPCSSDPFRSPNTPQSE
jgi:hypothetical protein